MSFDLPHFVLAIACAGEPSRRNTDWLVHAITAPSSVCVDESRHELRLGNGLIERVFRLAPDAATVAIDDLRTHASWLRAVEPEAIVVVDGVELQVGGLEGQPDRAYLTDAWLEGLSARPDAVHLSQWDARATEAPFEWLRTRHSEERPWPPPGKKLTLWFQKRTSPKEADEPDRVLHILVRYEIYDGIPVIAKWLEIGNATGHPITIDAFVAERLALVEAESIVDDAKDLTLPPVTLLSDFSMHGMDAKSSRQTTRWVPDPRYATQVNYSKTAPMLLESSPPLGPGIVLAPLETLTTFRTYELFHDSTERERQGLAVRRAFRVLAPWCTENPLLMHARDARPEAVELAIDQCAEVGFEMVIQSFGSGFDAENKAPAYLEQQRDLALHAHAKGVQIGGYSLLSSRSVGPETDVIDPRSGAPGGAIFGSAPCLQSAWGQAYFAELRTFFERTGMDVLEHDGSYPGDVCASTKHVGHKGLADSQWRQWETIRDFYRWCRGRGVYLDVPDFYFLAGSSKTGMGYRETNWSLPREEQPIHARQNMFDGTWTKTPSMGWMFVPLTEYQGGGAAATIEPLKEHLDAYEAHLASTFLFGVQACWRGPRLYDAPETKDLVAKWVGIFKRHRAILESDVIHLRRADGRDIDYVLHVNPAAKERALLAVFNPLDRDVAQTLTIPLYYAGFETSARVAERDGPATDLALARDYTVQLPVRVPARSATWFTFE